MQLTKGANAPLTSSTVTITVTGAAVDLCALLITSDRRVRSDADLVFYNQPASTCGHVRLQDPARIRVLLDGLAPEIETVVVAAASTTPRPAGSAPTCRSPSRCRTVPGSCTTRSRA